MQIRIIQNSCVYCSWMHVCLCAYTNFKVWTREDAQHMSDSERCWREVGEWTNREFGVICNILSVV